MEHLRKIVLSRFYLKQIQRLNPILNGVIEVNPKALYLANKADFELKSKAPASLSGLHGIPIQLKDNIATKDKLNTIAGLEEELEDEDGFVIGYTHRGGGTIVVLIAGGFLERWLVIRLSFPLMCFT